MAKKYGKRRKSGAGEPRDMFGAPPPLRAAPVRPASSTPLADYLSANWPGVSEGYVVLPRSLAEAMSLPWQQQMAAMLAQFHQTHRGLSWPVYRVVPSRYENLVDLDEEQLAEAGYLVEIDADGEMVYRERSGRKVEEPEATTVLVSCLDPIPPRGSARAAEAAAQEPERPRAAPMNIPPPPVWRTTPAKPAEGVPPLPERTRPAPPRSEQAGGQEWAPGVGGHSAGPASPGQPTDAPPSAEQVADVQAPGVPTWTGQSIEVGPPSGRLPAANAPTGQTQPPQGGAESAAPPPEPSEQATPAQPPAGQAHAGDTSPPQASAAHAAPPQGAPAHAAPPQPLAGQAAPPQAPVGQAAPPQDPAAQAAPPGQPPQDAAPSGAAPAQPATPSAPSGAGEPNDEDTPPRGIPVSDRGWFDPLPGEESSDEPADFGPTGDPTELPYRYRP